MDEKHVEETVSKEVGKQQPKAAPLQIAAIVLSSAAIVAAGAIFLTRKQPEAESPAVQKIGMEAGIITNEESDVEINNKPFSFATLYQRDIYIADGRNATCYIGNSEGNYYEDMYIQLYLNGEDDQPQMEEPLYISQIIPRGSHIESFEVERDLEPGEYRGTLVHSTIDETGNLVGDVPVIVDIHVAE